MAYAIKAEIHGFSQENLVFTAQKTMYGGKRIAPGDRLFLFASETQGGEGLVAVGTVKTAEAVAKQMTGKRENQRVSVAVDRLIRAKGTLGRKELKPFASWADEQPQTELNFKFYRQATNKIVAITDATAAFLEDFF